MQKKLGKLYILVNELLIQIVHILVSESLVNLGENSDSVSDRAPYLAERLYLISSTIWPTYGNDSCPGSVHSTTSNTRWP